MRATALLDQLREQGFSLRVDNAGRLHLRPRSMLTNTLRDRVAANKDALLGLLREQASANRCDATDCRLALATPRDALTGGWCVSHSEAGQLLNAATLLGLDLAPYRKLAQTGDIAAIAAGLLEVWAESDRYGGDQLPLGS